MADNFKFVQMQAVTLAGAGCSIGDTSIILNSFNDIDGNALAMTNFGSIGFGTIEPNASSQEEQISFTGVTVNANGTVTLTGVKNVAFTSPYTETSGVQKTHPGGAKFIISNTSGFYDKLTSKSDDETIDGLWTFTQSPLVPTPDGLTASQVASVGYVQGIVIAGGVDASTTTKGISKLSVAAAIATNPVVVGDNDPRVSPVSLATLTASQVAALGGDSSSVAVPSATNTFVTQQGFQRNQENYAVATGSSSALVLALGPTPVALIAGMQVSFQSPVTTQSPVTLNVNNLGAKSLVKAGSSGTTVLAAGDIATNVLVVAEYNGNEWQMISPTSSSGTSFSYLVSSSNLKWSADIVETSTSTSFTLKKKILLAYGGTVSVSFDIKSSVGAGVNGQIYINGTAYGVNQTTSLTSYQTFIQDIECSAGSLIELYIKCGGGDTVSCRNFRISYDKNTISVDGIVITD